MFKKLKKMWRKNRFLYRNVGLSCMRVFGVALIVLLIVIVQMRFPTWSAQAIRHCCALVLISMAFYWTTGGRFKEPYGW